MIRIRCGSLCAYQWVVCRCICTNGWMVFVCMVPTDTARASHVDCYNTLTCSFHFTSEIHKNAKHSHTNTDVLHVHTPPLGSDTLMM